MTNHNKGVHALVRTSPTGTKFRGTCLKCGLQGLTISQSTSFCENITDITDKEALLLILEQRKQK